MISLISQYILNGDTCDKKMKLNFIYCLMLAIELIIIFNKIEFHWAYTVTATPISQLQTCPY